VAAVYKSRRILLYQDGELIRSYATVNKDLLSYKNNLVVFGRDHLFGDAFLDCSIEDARIYSRALSPEELAGLEANIAKEITPWAWWDFESNNLVERTGRFHVHDAGEESWLLKDGKLVLGQWNAVVANREYNPETPAWPEDPPAHWPAYHLAHPGPYIAEPGDPNPAFFYKGLYHLHYIYHSRYGYMFAHLSGKDMVRWNWHETVLGPPTTGHGMFSGTGFFTTEGQPAMIYHGLASGYNQIAYAMDDSLNMWTKPVAVVPFDDSGDTVHINQWDPDCWFCNDNYYALSGGRDPELMKSKDLKEWQYMGKLLHKDFPVNLGGGRDEDISCANIFPIGNKWMLLCISHELGCRYFLGDFVEEKYLPDYHARMNWRNTNWEEGPGGAVYFAPESLLTPDGRRVMWAWIITELEPSGIQSLPRELELPEDGILRIRPLKELESLRSSPMEWSDLTATLDEPLSFPGIKGNTLELELLLHSPLPDDFVISLLGDENGEGALKIRGGKKMEFLKIGTTEPDFTLEEGEGLHLRIFVDRQLVEVFANDRQAAVCAHPYLRNNLNLEILTGDSDLHLASLRSWKMNTIY
jgi:sucrose-6-phosphate hydrolase SacC (GH32 family)